MTNKSIEIIDNLHEKQAYCIDIFPCTIKSEKFFEVEEVFLKRNLKQYVKKICNIILILWGIYDMEIYLTEFPSNSQYKKYASLAYQNIVDIGLDRLCKIIEYIIKHDVSSVEILVPSHEFEISICGEFNTTIYNISGEDLELIQSLVEQQQLYIRQCNK